TLPPVAKAPIRGRDDHKVSRQPAARPAPPVVTQPAPPPATPTTSPPRRPVPAQTIPVSTATAALPVREQAAATAVVTQTAVRPTTLFIQAGAFANYDNAYRMSVRLSRYGRAKVSPYSGTGQQLF